MKGFIACAQLWTNYPSMFTLGCVLLLYLQITWQSYFLITSFVGMVYQSVVLVTMTHVLYPSFRNSWLVHRDVSNLLVLLIILKHMANLNILITVLNRFYAAIFPQTSGIGTASYLF